MTTTETISQGSQPCQGVGEFRVRLGLPDEQERERDDQQSERRENVGQRIVWQVRGDELTDREAAAGDEQHRPERFHRAHAAVDRHHVERQDDGNHRQLRTDHRAERGGRQPGDRAERRHRHAEGAKRHRRGVEDQHEYQRLERLDPDEDQEGRGDRDRRPEA
jgi:hypothetical protein